MNIIIGVGLILTGIIISVFAVNNIRKVKGFNLISGGFNMLYISIALVSIGAYIV